MMAESMIRNTVRLKRKSYFGDLIIFQFSYKMIEMPIKHFNRVWENFVTGYINAGLIFLVHSM